MFEEAEIQTWRIEYSDIATQTPDKGIKKDKNLLTSNLKTLYWED